jgi:8-oxo-dGTP pyrophosphatase MutT (NUDIX family)
MKRSPGQGWQEAHGGVARGNGAFTEEASPGDFLARLRAVHPPVSTLPWELCMLDSFPLSAVLLPFVRIRGELFLLLEERSDDLRAHAGQLAFPGGRKDPGDFSPEDTALRELEEELAIERSSVRLYGVLPFEFAYSSDFIIVPLWGEVTGISSSQALRPATKEVKAVHFLPLSSCLHPARFVWRSGKSGRHFYPVYAATEEKELWGASARMLYDLLRPLCTREIPSSWH